MARLWVPAFALAVIVLSIVLFAATRGWFGPLVICGVDAAPLCVAWPVWSAALTWLLVVGTIVGLVYWQVAEWRRHSS